ncbi:MAG: GXWXG domain-containing protein [Pseudomonadota bacterium]
MTPEEATAWFDSLPPATEADMLGPWRGAEVPTGHPMDGLLAASSWAGKRFESAEAVHPLIHDVPLWGTRALNPRFLPLGLITSLPARDVLLKLSFPILAPLFFTSKPRARLRTLTHRGRPHAAMCYDDRPIHDIFARISETERLGWMDFKGMDQPYFFKLTRAE